MKKIIVPIILAFAFIYTKAQEVKMKVIAPIEFEVSYELNQLCDYPNQYRAEDWREKGILILEIGKDMTHSYAVKEHNDIVRQLTTFYNKNRWNIEMFNLHALLGETYMGYPQIGELTQIVNLDAAGIYQYTESRPEMKWRLKPEHKTILGYDCQRATCSFRGREYEAWFTLDIPLSYGPWKFHGLPGLILEVADTKNEYHFMVKGIEKPTQDKQIKIFDAEIRTIKRSRALKMQAMLHKDQGTFAADYGITFRLEGGREHNASPYYPIELK